MTGTVPCRTCGASIPIEHARCSRCGTPVPGGALADLPTVPGQGLIRAPRRRRASTFDYVPPALADELARRQGASAAHGAYVERARAQKRLIATVLGAAATSLPFLAANVVFLPRKSGAVLAAAAHALIGALAARVVDRYGGGLGKTLAAFIPGFALACALEAQVGYPFVHNPAAGAVLGLAAVLALLAASFLGVALDEHA